MGFGFVFSDGVDRWWCFLKIEIKNMKYFYRNFMFLTCYIYYIYRILSLGNYEYLNYKDVRW